MLTDEWLVLFLFKQWHQTIWMAWICTNHQSENRWETNKNNTIQSHIVFNVIIYYLVDLLIIYNHQEAVYSNFNHLSKKQKYDLKSISCTIRNDIWFSRKKINYNHHYTSVLLQWDPWWYYKVEKESINVVEAESIGKNHVVTFTNKRNMNFYDVKTKKHTIAASELFCDFFALLQTSSIVLANIQKWVRKMSNSRFESVLIWSDKTSGLLLPLPRRDLNIIQKFLHCGLIGVTKKVRSRFLVPFENLLFLANIS